MFILFAALGCLVFVVTYSNHDSSKRDRRVRLVFSGPRTDVATLYIETGCTKAKIVRRGRSWVIKGKGREGVADNDDVEELLDDIMRIEKIRTIGPIEQIDLQEFGFTKPFLVASVSYIKGTHEKLIIGSTHPSGTCFYAMVDGSDEIFLVGLFYPEIIRIKVGKLISGMSTENTVPRKDEKGGITNGSV